jgi:hypothetical protein
MKKVVLRVLLTGGLVAAVATIALPAPAMAQSVGTLVGHVIDQTGSPIRGVRIVASSETQIGGPKATNTDDAGQFRLTGLTPGLFTVTASAPRLKSSVHKNVRVVAATENELDILMEVETADEQVRVIEKAPVVNTNRATVGEDFDADFINNLPLSSRSYQGVTTLAAGVTDLGGTGNPNIRGGSYFNNSYNIDGFQTTDPVTHTFGQNFSFDAMNQVQVQTAAFGAENSGTLGGITNVVTKSGSNRFEFDGTALYSDHNLRLFKDARDIGTTRRIELSLNSGGPIVKDRLWYYFSGEGIADNFTLPRDPVFRDHPPINLRAFNGFAKLTWQITPRNKLEGKASYSPGEWDNLIQSYLVEGEAEANQFQATRFFGLQWHSVITDNIFLQMRSGLQQLVLSQGPQSCEWDPATCTTIAGEVDLVTGIRRQNYTSQQKDRRETIELSGSLEWFADSKVVGNHGFKLGGLFLNAANEVANTVPGNFVYYTAGREPYERVESCSNDPRNSNGVCNHNWQFSEVFGQTIRGHITDAWKPFRYLTITPEAAVHYGKSRDDRSTTVTDMLAFTPHLSVVWDPTHDGRTALKASVNSYVDTGFLALARFTSRSLFQRDCLWDPDAQAYVRQCRQSGGDSGTTIGKPCGPDGVNPDGSSCVTALRAPRVWEVTTGVEREIVTGISLGADYVYRRFDHQWEDSETNAIWNAGGTGLRRDGRWKTGRPEFVYDLGTPDAARRRYHSATVKLAKKEGLLKVQGSYTWTDYRGTADNNFAGLFLDNPGQSQYFYGPLQADIRHHVKLQGQYQFLPWLSAGVTYEFFTGSPYNRFTYDATFGSFSAFQAQRGHDSRGTLDPDDDAPLRLPDISMLNLQARANLRPLIKQNISVWVDLDNLLALRTHTGVIQQDGPFWGRPQGRLPPMSARLGLQFRF